MSMKYEGDGIMLNIDRIVRMIFSEGLEGDLRTSTELRETGRTSVFIRLDTLERSPWQHYDLRAVQDHDRKGWVIFISDRSWKSPSRPRLVSIVDQIEEADYTIESSDDPRTVEPLGLLPPTTK